MGPWNMPWMTFMAIVVIIASAVIAAVWAIVDIRKARERR
jgi:hypothetical protein